MSSAVDNWINILYEKPLYVAKSRPTDLECDTIFYSYISRFEWKIGNMIYSIIVDEEKASGYGMTLTSDRIVNEYINSSPIIKERLANLIEDWERVNSL